jgi:hypothetical protein
LSEKLTSQIRDDIKLSGDDLANIEKALSSGTKEASGIISSFWAILLDDLRRPFRIRTARKKRLAKLNLPHEIQNEMIGLVLKKTLLERRILFLNRIQQLFHYWHVFHKPFAIIMYIIMIVHVAVAVWLGYVWIF